MHPLFMHAWSPLGHFSPHFALLQPPGRLQLKQMGSPFSVFDSRPINSLGIGTDFLLAPWPPRPLLPPFLDPLSLPLLLFRPPPRPPPLLSFRPPPEGLFPPRLFALCASCNFFFKLAICFWAFSSRLAASFSADLAGVRISFFDGRHFDSAFLFPARARSLQGRAMNSSLPGSSARSHAESVHRQMMMVAMAFARVGPGDVWSHSS